MTTQSISPVFPWSADLESSRNVEHRDRDAFAMVLGWFEHWRLRVRLEPGREACKRFCREQVLVKDREPWQLEKWSGAMQWYLRWLKYQQANGGEARSLEDRVRVGQRD